MQQISEYNVSKIQIPIERNLEADISWVAASLGFLGKRDQDKTALKILTALIRALPNGEGLTSDELADIVKPTRGSVVYHLKKLINTGLVVKINSKYQLKQRSLGKTIDDFESELKIVINDIKSIANEIDKNLK